MTLTKIRVWQNHLAILIENAAQEHVNLDLVKTIAQQEKEIQSLQFKHQRVSKLDNLRAQKRNIRTSPRDDVGES